jgi:hypothetical protein
MCSASILSNFLLGVFDRLRSKGPVYAEDSVKADDSDLSHVGKHLRDRLRDESAEGGTDSSDHNES